jgi:dipeptidyl aminopeptidase/acylaminoacyl peptidase
MKSCLLALAAAAALPGAIAQESGLVADGIPPITEAVRTSAAPYMEFRTAAFLGWHPQRKEMLVATRFADTPQLHAVRFPAGARRQLTFLPEPIRGGGWQPKSGQSIVFVQDAGGGENYQFFRFDPVNGRTTRLTDGKSRHTGLRWAHDGSRFAYASTQRTGKDTDLWIMDPDEPGKARLACELSGGGWGVTDWSHDGQWLAVAEMISANESHLWLVNAASGERTALTDRSAGAVARSGALFSRDGATVYFTSDEGSDFQHLGSFSLKDRRFVALTRDIPWNIEEFTLDPAGKTIAFTANEDGASRLRFLSLADSRISPPADLPLGTISGLEWHPDGSTVGFTLSSAQSPADAWSISPSDGKLTRWTESETGGLDPAQFRDPEIVRCKSFDGTPVSGLLYRPDPARFPGRRPTLVTIHGGPEGQSRPGFQGRNNYWLNELGVALLYPNVRGSDGYGKRFLAMDNGFKRKDSVRDIAAFLDFIAADPALDPARTGVTGGSYGGYMTLACLIDFPDRFKAGCDIVGISNFLTFLANTSGYRRDLRRVEYGDERDPAMAKFLEEISPTAHASKIRAPLFIVQGKNDPRVPVTEAEQMVKAVREAGPPVWYLMAPDEGHGFAKKANIDSQFLSTITFWQTHLLGGK